MVKLKGALNFRDIGGYAAAKGKHVKWGKIYRSAEINNLTTADLDSLQARHINYDMDFRGPSEVSIAPDKIPVGATRISLPAGSEGVGDRTKMMEMMSKASTGDSIMLPFYTNIQSFTDRYKPVFATLLNNNKDSAVIIPLHSR
ncbi:MAG: tyrosine-protein phosphatase [Ferruginibacter sp.]